MTTTRQRLDPPVQDRGIMDHEDRDRHARPVQHRRGGTRRGVAPVRHPASRRRPARPRHPSGAQDHRRRRAAHARLQRLDPRVDAPRRPGGGDHRPGKERRRHRDHRALARPAAGEPLRRRPARDADSPSRSAARSATSCSSPTPASTGITRTCAKTTGRRWACTAPSSSSLPTHRSGLRPTGSSPSPWTTCS